jgi:hypothetical protein
MGSDGTTKEAQKFFLKSSFRHIHQVFWTKNTQRFVVVKSPKKTRRKRTLIEATQKTAAANRGRIEKNWLKIQHVYGIIFAGLSMWDAMWCGHGHVLYCLCSVPVRDSWMSAHWWFLNEMRKNGTTHEETNKNLLDC